ncbi:MAG: phosphohistidine phosphatase SixA [Gammaproteobacteria bacterium]|jgi:phosphohistidine phosphatase
MKLYLVQHGNAVDKEIDPQRPLSEQGEQDVKAMATFLRGAGVRVERVWHSGKRRAGQTADILARKLLAKGEARPIEGIHPNDPVEAFATDADVWDQDTLVAGHQPFMGRLVAYLVAGDADRAVVEFLPGSVVCLERRDVNDWVVCWMLRPELL